MLLLTHHWEIHHGRVLAFQTEWPNHPRGTTGPLTRTDNQDALQKHCLDLRRSNKLAVQVHHLLILLPVLWKTGPTNEHIFITVLLINAHTIPVL